MDPGARRRVVFISGREPAYVRNHALLRGLHDCGVEVVECTSEHRSYPRRLLTVVRKWFSLRLRREPFDAVVVGFLAQPLIPLIWATTSRPIVADLFISLYDTLVYDRRRVSRRGLVGSLCWTLDWAACRAADVALFDTPAHARYFHEKWDSPLASAVVIPVGADEEIFRPSDTAGDGTVFYYSNNLSVHGLDVVLSAAELLQDDPVRFVIGGVEAPPAGAPAPPNVSFLGWVPLDTLADHAARASLCLGGHFSRSPKASRVVAGKVYQFLATARATIVTDLPANRALLTHGHDCLFCSPGDAFSLADAIRDALRDPVRLHRIGWNGLATFRREAGRKIVAERVGAALEAAGVAS